MTCHKSVTKVKAHAVPKKKFLRGKRGAVQKPKGSGIQQLLRDR